MDLKFFLMCASVAIGTASYIVYIRQHFAGGNLPHPFSWLVWSLTATTIAAAMVHGGAGFGAIPFVVNALLVIAILFISLRGGTACGATASDFIFLAVALAGLVAWWLMGDPLVAVFLVTGVDLSGYFPTYHKLLSMPKSESLSAWIGFLIANICAIFAVENYTLTTLTYPVVITLATVALIVISLIAGRTVSDSAA